MPFAMMPLFRRCHATAPILLYAFADFHSMPLLRHYCCYDSFSFLSRYSMLACRFFHAAMLLSTLIIFAAVVAIITADDIYAATRLLTIFFA